MKRYLLSLIIVLSAALNTFGQGPGGIDTANMILWVKSDSGVIFDADSNVTRWTDLSGYGNHLDSNGVGKMPNFIHASSNYNGQNVIKFSGDSFDVLKSDAFTTVNMSAGGWSLFLFFQYNKGSSQTGAGWFSTADVASAPAVQLRLSGNNFRIEGNNQGGNSTPMGSSVMSAPIVYTLVRDVTGATVVENQSGVETINKSFGATAAYQVSLFKLGEDYASTSFSDMEVTEVIFLARTATPMEVRMVENYFASKYGAALTGNDYYAGDETLQGDYDMDIAGIGTDGVDTQYSTISGGIHADIVAGFGTDDYFFFGHKTDSNTANKTDTAGIGGSDPARWDRVYYFDVTNTTNGDPIAQLTFDMSETGGSQDLTLASATDYVLIYRATDGSGAWTIVDTASSIANGDQVVFDSVTLTNDGYYTLATLNYTISPVPVEMISFTGALINDVVQLKWATASEENNDYFEVQRSADGINWQVIGVEYGSGNSVNINNYVFVDISPLKGASYYRLKQVDYDGDFEYSKVIRVANKSDQEVTFTVAPNPNNGQFEIIGNVNPDGIKLLNSMGQTVSFSYSTEGNTIKIFAEGLKAGVYTLVVQTHQGLKTQKIIIQP